MQDEAVEEMRKANKKDQGVDSQFLKFGLASILARSGRMEDSKKTFEEAMAGVRPGYESPAAEAMVRFDLGQLNEAFSLLKKAVDEHDGFILYLLNFHPYFRFATDRRWDEIKRQIWPASG